MYIVKVNDLENEMALSGKVFFLMSPVVPLIPIIALPSPELMLYLWF